MRVQAEQEDKMATTPKHRRWTWGTVLAPLCIVALLGAAMATSPRLPWRDSEPQLVAAPGEQVHYLPFDAQQFYDTLLSEQTNLPAQDMRLIASVVSARDANTVAIDHWEDGYDVDPVNSPGATTEVSTMAEGEVQVLDNVVVLADIGDITPGGSSQPYYDGRDKIVSTSPTVVTMGGWPDTTGSVHAGASAVPEVSRYGYQFTSPVGEDTPYISATASPWEYTGMFIQASQDDTTVTVAGGAPITLDEGDVHLVDGGIDLGDTVDSDKPVAVYLATGDVDARYEGRVYELTPTERWTDTYFSPVTSFNTTNLTTRVFFYNPGGLAITVDYTQSDGVTGTVSVPAAGQASYRMRTGLGARFTSTGNPFYALQAITAPVASGTDDSASYNWGFSLIPEAYLTPMVVLGYAPGSSNLSANYSAVWVAPQADTTIYVDRDGDTGTGALTDANGNKYDFSCAITALSPRLISDDATSNCYTDATYSATVGSGDGDMTGARIYTLDGTALAAAWGQVPGLQASNPAIDMGTTVLPFPTVDLTKTSDIVDDDGDGLADPGETIRYTISATNAGITPVDNLVVTDEVPAHTTYVAGTTVHNGSAIADDGSGTPFPLDGAGTTLPPALNVGQTRTVTFDVVVDQPLDPSVTQIVNQATLSTSYGTYTAVDIQPTAPPEPSIAIAKTVYRGHDGGASCQGGDAVTGENGDAVTYCFAVTNDGSLALAPVTLDDADLGIDQTDLSVVSGDLTSMDPGDVTLLYYETSVDGDLTNTATVTGTAVDGGGVPVPAVDPVTDSDTASVDEVAPGLAVAKTVYRGHDGGALCAGAESVVGIDGDAVTYCFTVTNTGDTTLAPVTVADPDLGIDQSDMGVLSGDLALLAPGDSVELFYETALDGDLTNTATAGGTPSDPNGDPLPGLDPVTDDDTASADQVAPAVSVAKTVYHGQDAGAGCPGGELVHGLDGDAVTYCFTVTNEGDTELSPVTVEDGDLGIDQSDMTALSGDLASLAPGDSATLYYETTLSGDLTNTATVTGVPADGSGDPLPGIEPVTGDDTAVVDAVGPAVQVAKTAYRGHDGGAGCEGAETTYVHAGDDVTYCFAVTNNGDTPLAPVTVGDLDLGIDQTDMTVVGPGSLDSIDPGDTVVLYYETTADGDLTNTASAFGTPVDGNGDPLDDVPDVTDDDTAVVDEVAPAVSVAKTVYRGHDAGAGCPGGELVQLTNGGDVTYCFVVTNDGDTTLSPVSVVDLDLGIDQSDMVLASGSLSSLAPGDSAALYFETTVDGDLTNTATVTGTPVDDGGTPLGIDPVTGDDTAEVDEVGPAVSVAKTVYAGHDSGAGCPGAELQRGAGGAEVTYCFVVTNDGDTVLDPVTLDDADLGIDQSDMAVASGSLSSLAPGDSAVLYYETTIDGDLVNTATVTGTPVDGGGDPIPGLDPVSADDSAEVDEVTPSVALAKTVYRGHDAGGSCPGSENVPARSGQDVTYCFVVTNNGGATLAPVTIDDADLGIDQSDMVVASGSLSSLDPGDSTVLYYETTVAGDLTNTATATGTPVDGGDPLPGSTPVTSTDTASVDEVVPSVSVDKTVYGGHDGGAGCPGGELEHSLAGADVTYCFSVTNDGDTTLAPVTLDDGDLGITDGDLTVLSGDLGQLDPGDTAVLYYETTVDGDLTNTVTATGTLADSGGDPLPGLDPVTDTDTAEVDEVAPAVSVAKTVYRGHDGGAGCPGGELIEGATGADVTYCFAVTNTGDTTLAPVTVADDLLGVDETDLDVVGGGSLTSLAAGDTVTLYFETVLDGDLTNTATAGGTPVDDGGDPIPGLDPVTDDDTARVDDVSPSVSVAKTVYYGHDGGAGCPGAEAVATRSGANVTYCFVVTNDGESALSPVTLDDAALNVTDGDLTVVSGDLSAMAPGDSATLYYETTVDGDLTNTVIASGEPVDSGGDPLPGGQTVTDEDTAVVDEVAPSVSVAKTVYRGHDDGAGCAGSESVTGRSGDAVTYCFAVTNDGDTTLSPVTVGDVDLGIDQTDMSVVGPGSLASLDPGDSIVLYFETAIDGDLTNTVTAYGTPVDGNGDPLDNVPDVTDDDTAAVDEVAPAVSVAKTVYRGHDDGAGCPGAELATTRSGANVTYCFAVTNEGDTALAPVTLEDPDLGIDQTDLSIVGPGSLASLDPGDSVTLFYETTVDGDLTNTATVTGTPADQQGDPLPGLSDVTADDTAQVDEVAPSISVAKTVYRTHDAGAGCNGTDVLAGLAGEDVTYCFAVTNDGDTTLAPVTVADPDLGIDESDMTVVGPGSLASLAPGETVVLYYETTVDGDLTNTATATGSPVDGQGDRLAGVPDVTADDTAQVYEVAPSVAVVKTVYRGHDGGAGCPGSNLVAGRNGDDVTYCFAITNDGDTTLAPVTVADADLGIDQSDMDVLSGDLSQLDPGDTAVLYLETTVDGDLVNTAVATGSPADGNGDPLPGVDDVTDEDTAAVDAVGPAVHVAKTVYLGHDGGAGCAGDELVSATGGTDITYCFEVTNNGDTALSPVTLDDADLGIDQSDLTVVGPGGLSTLGAGETVVLYYETTVDGDLTNTAAVTGTPVDGQGDPLGIGDVTDEDTAQVDGIAPSVAVAKTVYRGHDDGAGCPGSESVSGVAGRAVTYCFVVTNDGDTTLAPVTLDDADLGVDQVTLSVLNGDLSSMAPGDTATLYYETTLDGDLTNTATATGTPVDGTSTPLPGVSDVTDDDTARVDQIAPSMTLLTEVLDPFTGDWFDADGDGATPGSNDPSPATLRAGDTASYRFTVANTGDAGISDVVVDAPQCDAAPVVVSGDTVNPGVLDEGETWVLTCNVTDVGAGFTLDAVVTGDSIDGAPDGSGDHETARAQVASIAVEKTVLDPGTGDFVDAATIETGGDATFRIVVTNTGEVPLSDVAVGDALASSCARGFVDTLEPGDSFAAYTCVVTGVDAGFVNTATATGTPVDDRDAPIGADVTGEDGASVGVDTAPETDLAITKDLIDIDEALAIATWQVTVTNVGDVDATQPIVVTDDLPPELDYRDAGGDGWVCEFDDPTITCLTDTDLVPGGSTTFTVQTYVESEPGDTITNVARVDGIDDTNTDNNTDDAVVDVNDQGQLVPDVPSSLPRTGADIAGLLAGAGVLILTGLAFRRSARRRQA